MVDDVLDQHKERFLLHYNFPPFSTGEAKAQRGVGRREIGHGHLAWRALKGQVPANYPYSVRVVSDILESNGSSSMATVCAGTLALMDAGVPMKKPVSGIAMGLIKNAGEENMLYCLIFLVTKTTWEIWTSRLPVPVTVLLLHRWISRSMVYHTTSWKKH